jgi:hyaluronate lyase
VRATREDRTGSWREINTGNDTGGSTTPHTRRYLSLVVEHGTDVGEYSYILLPGASRWRTAARAADPGVTVLANTAEVQAVRSGRDRLTLANFWTAGAAGGISTSGPTSVVVGTEGRTITVAVSDPSRTVGALRLIVDNRVARVLSADDTVTVVAAGKQIVLDIAVGGSRGATHTATFSRP